MLLKLLIQFLFEEAEMAGSLYNAKNILKGLWLGYEVIHACKDDCMLFWKEDESLDKCPIYGDPRYKSYSQGKNIPHKVL